MGGPGANRAGGPKVYQLVDGRPKSATIKVGLSDGEYTELTSGALSEGDAIITDRNWSGGGGRGRRDMTRMFR